MLVVAIGNPLRRDDGAAHYVSKLLGSRPDVAIRAVLQLAPEMAEEIARHDAVVFVDADVSLKRVRIEPVDARPPLSPLTHVSSPNEIVALARALLAFRARRACAAFPRSTSGKGKGSARERRS